MFFSDGTLWETIAEAQGVGGDQWGVMNELWNFPGQVWLWLYSGMYQIPALNPSNNANLDLDVGLLMILFGFLLPMFAPWIPVINRIPRWIPLYKIIYRKYYAASAGGQPPAEVPSEPVPPPPRRETSHRRPDDSDELVARQPAKRRWQRIPCSSRGLSRRRAAPPRSFLVLEQQLGCRRAGAQHPEQGLKQPS